MLTALALVLCTAEEPALGAAPSQRSARLMTDDEVAGAPVEMLTLPQLEAEALRLDTMPALAPPVVALAVGGGVFLAAGAVVGALVWVFTASRCGECIVVSPAMWLGSALAASGALMAGFGGSFLPSAVVNRRWNAERQVAVRARAAAVRAGTALEPTPQAQTQVIALERQRPDVVVPVLLITCGALPLIIGVISFATSTRHGLSNPGLFPVSIGLIVAGLMLEGAGAWQLITRLQTREELDQQMRALEAKPGDVSPSDGSPAPLPAPAGTSLPPVPMQLGFGWRF